MRLEVFLDMMADSFPERVVLGTSGAPVTAAEARMAAARGAHYLRQHGADSLVHLAENGTAYTLGLFSASYAGLPMVPLNYRLATAQLHQLMLQHPRAVIVAADEVDLPEGAGVARLTPSRWLELLTDPAGATDVQRDHGGTGEDVAAVIYTSGTTSAPKAVLLRHEKLTSYVLGTVDFLSAAEGEAALVSVPPYHVAGLANALSNFYAGRRTVVLSRFDPELWFDTVRGEGVTNAMVVPTMMARLLEAPGDKQVPSLRTLSYGGAPMPRSVIERALRTWPHVGFVNAYGLTETSSTVALLGPEEHRAALTSDDEKVRDRLRSVGQPLPGIRVEIRGEDGTPLPAGQVGRIHLAGSQIAGEYGGLGSVLGSDGFFDTRDDGHLDGDGYLYIEGRADDTIIRGGENIAPAEVEEVIASHPDVVEAAVVGVADEEWGERLEAAVVVRRGGVADADDLTEFTRARLRSSKTPARFHFVSALPRTETGKLLRREVVNLLS